MVASVSPRAAAGLGRAFVAVAALAVSLLPAASPARATADSGRQNRPLARVEVALNQIHVRDDGDNLGSGEVHYEFFVATFNRARCGETACYRSDFVHAQDASTGNVIQLGRVLPVRLTRINLDPLGIVTIPAYVPDDPIPLYTGDALVISVLGWEADATDFGAYAQKANELYKEWKLQDDFANPLALQRLQARFVLLAVQFLASLLSGGDDDLGTDVHAYTVQQSGLAKAAGYQGSGVYAAGPGWQGGGRMVGARPGENAGFWVDYEVRPSSRPVPAHVVVSSVWSDPDPPEGNQPARYCVRVSNQGEAPASPFILRIDAVRGSALSVPAGWRPRHAPGASPVPGASSTLLGFQHVAQLGAGRSFETCTAPVTLPAGDQVVLAFVELGGNGEQNEFVSRAYPLPAWGAWEDLGGELTSGPAVASWSGGRLDVFAQGRNGHLWHRPYGGGRWGAWEDLGGELTSPPAAVSWEDRRLDVFARGRNNHLWHRPYGGGRWGGWEDLGGDLASGPAVASWEAGRLDVFAQGRNGHLWHLPYGGGRWGAWEDLGGSFSGEPAAVSWGPGRIDVFVRGLNNHLWQKDYDGSGWGAWGDRGGNLTAGPAVSSREPRRLSVFVRGANGSLVFRSYGPSGWGAWSDLGGSFSASPAAASWDRQRIDVFVRGQNLHLWHLPFG